MRKSQLDAIYRQAQNNSVSPFFNEESYFLHRMSELWGEEIWEEVEIEEPELNTSNLPPSSVSLCYTSA